MRLTLFQPDIPQNLGAAIRLCACFAVPLDIVEPTGFPLTDKAIRRAAMDYGALATIKRHDGWSAYLDFAAGQGLRLVLMSTKAERMLPDFRFSGQDALVLGRESAGVPDDVRQNTAAHLRIPICTGARSFNVINAGAIALYEGLRQTGGFAFDFNPPAC